LFGRKAPPTFKLIQHFVSHIRTAEIKLKQNNVVKTEYNFAFILLRLHYGRPALQVWTLYFSPAVSSIFFFFSLPNLNGRTLDVYHTSTHDVDLVRI